MIFPLLWLLFIPLRPILYDQESHPFLQLNHFINLWTELLITKKDIILKWTSNTSALLINIYHVFDISIFNQLKLQVHLIFISTWIFFFWFLLYGNFTLFFFLSIYDFLFFDFLFVIFEDLTCSLYKFFILIY